MKEHKLYDDEQLDVCIECGTHSVEYGTCLNCGENNKEV